MEFGVMIHILITKHKKGTLIASTTAAKKQGQSVGYKQFYFILLIHRVQLDFTLSCILASLGLEEGLFLGEERRS